MKKRTGLLTACIIVMLILEGCNKVNTVVNYPNRDDNIVTITFFGNKYESENVIIIEEIISAFMKENPDIRVSYESLKGTDYFDALEKRMAAGKGNDVFMVNHDAVLKLKAENQMADLSEIAAIEQYTSQMLSQMKSDEKIYWVPTIVSAFGIYCNLDLLRAHNQKIPKNLQEWREVCDYFVDQKITPIVANNDISLKTLAIGKGFYSVYQEEQQYELFERLNRGEENLSAYLSSGFALVEELIKKGYIDAEKTLYTKKTSDDLEEFQKGESPFMLTGAWAAGRLENMQPDFSFQVVPYSALEDGGFIVINADTRLSVNANSEHLNEAIKFVEFFIESENIQKFADQQSSFSPIKGGSPSSVEEIHSLISCYQSGKVVIGTDTLLDFPIWELTAQVSKKMLSGESLESAMEWMDQQIKGGEES